MRLLITLFGIFLIIHSYSFSQAKLDLKKELGFTIKSNKSEIIKFWKDKNIPYKLKNDDFGGKYFLIEDSLKPFMGLDVKKMRIVLDKDKVALIQLYFNDNDLNYNKVIEVLDDNANKKKWNPIAEFKSLFYDNLTVEVDDNKREITFLKN
jgi:hypothetical protein